MKYFMGIDIGGTMVKACIFDMAGRMVSSGSAATPVDINEDKHERNMEILNECVYKVIQEAVSIFEDDVSSIAGIGCTGHGKGLYLLNKEKRPVRCAIASTDFRANQIINQWKNAGVEKQSKQHTLQPLFACQPAALLRWLKEEEPDNYRQIEYVLSAKDYVRFLLTDQLFTEESDASGTALMNLTERKYESKLFQLYGIQEMFSKMPPLKLCTDICGCVTKNAANRTGLKEGTPVCGGMFDIDACALACGQLSQQDISVITGTWSINQYHSPSPLVNTDSTKVSLYCDGKQYLIEESSPTSAGNLEWCLSELFSGIDYAQADSIVSKYKASDCSVVFTPFLYGCIDAAEKSSFSGLTASTKKEDLLRAVYEGVIFAHRLHIERLKKTDPSKTGIKIAGGATKSDVWMQMFADITDMNIYTVSVKETGALGAAIAASVAVGDYDDLTVASENMVSLGKTFSPNKDEHAAYQQKYLHFKRLATVDPQE